MFQIIYLLLFMPLEEKLSGRLELFNEYTTMILLYHVFIFTNLVPSVLFQLLIGYSFMFFVIGNMGVHLFFLLKGTFFDCKEKMRERYKNC